MNTHVGPEFLRQSCLHTFHDFLKALQLFHHRISVVCVHTCDASESCGEEVNVCNLFVKRLQLDTASQPNIVGNK